MNTVLIVKDGGISETSIRKPPPYLPPPNDSPTIQDSAGEVDGF